MTLPSAIATLEPTLRQGAQALQLPLTHGQISALLHYLALLQKWNQVYNLSAVREPADMLRQHVLDSLAAVSPLQRRLHDMQCRKVITAERPARLLDVGSGGGLPGVVFAVCCSALHVDCVDTVAKKTAFIRQCAAQLRLPHLQAIHARVESLHGGDYDIIISRAFACLSDFVRWSAKALAPNGEWLAMKGKYPADEIAALPPEVQVFHVEHLQVPLLEAARCIVWMSKKA